MFLSVYYCEKVFHICFKAVYPVFLLLTDLKKLCRKALCIEKVLSTCVLSSVLEVQYLGFNAKFHTGASLHVNSSWKNPSGEWHVGYKLVYELFTGTLTSRLKVYIEIMVYGLFMYIVSYA